VQIVCYKAIHTSMVNFEFVSDKCIILLVTQVYDFDLFSCLQGGSQTDVQMHSS
jgi:hypothetical protein